MKVTRYPGSLVVFILVFGTRRGRTRTSSIYSGLVTMITEMVRRKSYTTAYLLSVLVIANIRWATGVDKIISVNHKQKDRGKVSSKGKTLL